jgi:type IV pilus assembly protein PilQ
MITHNNQFGLHMWKAIVFIMALLMGWGLNLAHAQTSPVPVAIEAVNASARGGTEVIRIDFSREINALPTGFVTQAPARISLDFMGVSSAIGRSNLAFNEANLRSVNVVQAGNRTRVVLNLKQVASYTAEIEGKSLLVTLQSAAATVRAPAANNSLTSFTDNRSRDSAPLRDIDFRRSTDGAGRVVITLPHDRVGVDVRQQGKGLTVEFLKTTLPEGLRRRLDVADFGTPVKVVTSTQAGDRVRMLIEPTGLWEHSAYQSDDKFVIEVKQIKTDPKKLTQGVGYNGQKLSLNFQNIEVRSLLQVFADFSNLNIVTSDTVTGSVTLRLQDVPWDQALDIILRSKNLDKRKNGNVLWIAPTEEIITKEKLDMEAASTVQTLEPVKTQFFQINYAKAEEIALQLTTNNASVVTGPGTGGAANSASARLLSPRGSVIAMKRTNQLFVTDIPSKLEEVQNLIAKVDVAVDQILIEARLVEASDNFGKSLGVKLGGADLRAVRGGDGGYQLNGNTRAAWGTNYSNVVGSSNVGAVGGVPVDQIGNFVNLPAGGLTSAPDVNPASLALSIFDATANRMLNLEISALEADGKGKVVSSPRVVTSNQKTASIENGYKIPYTKAGTNGGQPTTEFVPATLKLLVTPQTAPDGRIILTIEVNKDEPYVALGAGATKTKSVKTEVSVENGGTVVIGGIFEETKDTSETKVPFLGDIPFIGNLFKSKTTNTSKQELLVFITPKLLTDRTVGQ